MLGLYFICPIVLKPCINKHVNHVSQLDLSRSSLHNLKNKVYNDKALAPRLRCTYHWSSSSLPFVLLLRLFLVRLSALAVGVAGGAQQFLLSGELLRPARLVLQDSRGLLQSGSRLLPLFLWERLQSGTLSIPPIPRFGRK